MTLSPLIRHQPSFASLRNYYSILKRISVVKNETARETTSLFTLMNIDPFAALCIFYLVCVRLCARAFVMLLMVLFIPRRMWLHRRRHAAASSILRSSLRYTPPLLRPLHHLQHHHPSSFCPLFPLLPRLLFPSHRPHPDPIIARPLCTSNVIIVSSRKHCTLKKEYSLNGKNNIH